MRKVHEKSIVLGIGIGMIITSIAGMIYSAGTNKELSKEEIIQLAKGYGMFEKVKIINDGNKSVVEESPKTDDSSASSTTTDSSTPSNNDRLITIEIKNGDKSQHVVKQLLDKEVITSEKDFNTALNSYNATTKISIGTFKFKKNEDLDYIVKTICNITR